MIGGMGVDMVDGRCPFFEFGFVCLLDGFLPILHHLVQLLDGGGPGGFGESGKGFVVIPAERGGFAVVEIIELLAVTKI